MAPVAKSLHPLFNSIKRRKSELYISVIGADWGAIIASDICLHRVSKSKIISIATSMFHEI